ncbi:hypothetical protein D3C71_1757850 [compost metagenome]
MRGVVLQVHLHLRRLGVFADIGERFLHQTVDGQLGGLRNMDGFQIQIHGNIAAVRELLAQNLQGRGQAQIRE